MEKEASIESLWTIRQAAAWLSMTEHAVRCMLRRRQVPEALIVRVGRRIRFKAQELRRWILERR
jgi:hypothetical protein